MTVDPSAASRRSFLQTVATSALTTTALTGACSSRAPQPESAPAPATPAEPKPEAAKPPPRSGLPEGLSEKDFVVHGTTPLNLETRRDRFTTGPITPMSRTYLRANLPLPPASILEDRDAWRLEVHGVKNEGSLSLGTLKTLGLVSVTAVLQCSGNGRAFYPHKPSGSPWTVGAAANLMWTGVKVSDLVAHMGGIAGRVGFMTATGGEPIPAGLKADQVIVERSIPLDKALEHAILAWEANGEPLSLAHGGPLRLVVPGFYGVNFVKYVKTLTFAAEESSAKIQKSSYRVRPVGEKALPSHPSMWQMNVKSFLVAPPRGTVLSGRQRWVGVAFSGGAPIKSVELSTDGGKTWQPTQLAEPDLGPFAWRVFSLETKLTRGSYRLVTRAKDALGAVQPETRPDNHRGYGNNSWQDMGIDVKVVA